MAIIAALGALLPEVGGAALAEGGTAAVAEGGAAAAEGGALEGGAGALTANNALGGLFGQVAGAQQSQTNIAMQGMQTENSIVQQQVAQNDKNANDTLQAAEKKKDPAADDGGGGDGNGGAQDA